MRAMLIFRRAVSLSITLALSWSSLAVAAPAVVKYSTQARSAPFDVAPVVGVVDAGTKLSADPTADDGWRRVELPNGKFAYVRDNDIEVDLSSPSPLPRVERAEKTAAPATSTTAPEVVEPLPKAAAVAAPIYLANLDQLADFVKTDPMVFGLANDLANRRLTSTITIATGALAGVLLHVLAETAFQSKTCVNDGVEPGVCVKSTNRNLDLVGTSLLVVGPLLGWLMRPTHADETDIVNQWNARHPSHPMLDGAAITAP
jgi:hypothetical protein